MRPFQEAHRNLPEMDEKTQFVMLGSIHQDSEGPKALERWLKILRPDVVTLEFSNYGLQFRKLNGNWLREKLVEAMRDMAPRTGNECRETLEALLSYICLPYEFTVVSDYAQKAKTPLYLVDADEFSRLKLRGVDTMMERENIEALVGTQRNPPPGTSPERVLAELFFKRAIMAARYTEEMHIRDKIMRDRISLLMGHHGPGCYLHVCGWQHLCDPHGVYDPLKPVKVFVHDRTLCI